MKQREIKFRAWSEEHKQMAYFGEPDIITDSPTTYLSFPLYGWSPTNKHENNKYSNSIDTDREYGTAPVLMQYTGTKDIYGRDVYDGDIVKYTDGRTNREVVAWVEWRNGMFRIHGPLGWTGFNIDDNVIGFEVIGNLCENPDTQFVQ